MEDKEKTIIPPDLEPGTDKASFSRLRNKRNRALESIGQHTVASILLAGSPFPFSDAPFLTVSEGIMVARIDPVCARLRREWDNHGKEPAGKR